MFYDDRDIKERIKNLREHMLLRTDRTEARLQLLLDYLGLQEVFTPSQVTLRRKENKLKSERG